MIGKVKVTSSGYDPSRGDQVVDTTLAMGRLSRFRLRRHLDKMGIKIVTLKFDEPGLTKVVLWNYHQHEQVPTEWEGFKVKAVGRGGCHGDEE